MNSTNDLDRAIAAAREALAFHYKRAEFSDTPCHALDAIGALDDLLAALDAARGEAVAYALPKALAETRADGFTVVRAGHQHHADGTYCVPMYLAPPAALAVMQDLSERFSAMHAQGDVWITSLAAAKTVQAAMLAQQPAALAVPANVTPMRQPRADLARLVESINAAVYTNGNGLSVTEAIGALELAKLELLKEQEQ